MSFSLLPKMIAGAVTDLPADFLRQKGIKLLIMDFDNTLVPYTTNELTPQVLRKTWDPLLYPRPKTLPQGDFTGDFPLWFEALRMRPGGRSDLYRYLRRQPGRCPNHPGQSHSQS